MAGTDFFGGAWLGLAMTLGLVSIIYAVFYDVMVFFLNPMAVSLGVSGHIRTILLQWGTVGYIVIVVFISVLWYIKQSMRREAGQ